MSEKVNRNCPLGTQILQLSTPYTNHVPSNSATPNFRNFTPLLITWPLCLCRRECNDWKQLLSMWRMAYIRLFLSDSYTSCTCFHALFIARMPDKADLNSFPLAEVEKTNGINQDAPILRGWRLPSRTWNQWTSPWMKQLTWLRITHSGDWCLRLALRTHSGACQKWMNEWMTVHTPQNQQCPVWPDVIFIGHSEMRFIRMKAENARHAEVTTVEYQLI